MDLLSKVDLLPSSAVAAKQELPEVAKPQPSLPSSPVPIKDIINVAEVNNNNEGEGGDAEEDGETSGGGRKKSRAQRRLIS